MNIKGKKSKTKKPKVKKPKVKKPKTRKSNSSRKSNSTRKSNSSRKSNLYQTKKDKYKYPNLTTKSFIIGQRSVIGQDGNKLDIPKEIADKIVGYTRPFAANTIRQSWKNISNLLFIKKLVNKRHKLGIYSFNEYNQLNNYIDDIKNNDDGSPNFWNSQVTEQSRVEINNTDLFAFLDYENYGDF